MILVGDALEQLKVLSDESVHCCVTSPPYWGLRDYGVDGQLGLEQTPEQYVTNLVEIFREVKRVLRSDGTLWLNLGDSYASARKGSGEKTAKQSTNKGSFYSDIKAKFDHGLKEKDLVGIPWRVAFALQADGWWLRSDIIWHKPNCMPLSVKDRPTTSHEYIFLLSKSSAYFYDYESILEPIANESINRYEYGFKDMRSGKTKGMRKCGEIVPRGQSVPNREIKFPRGRNKRTVWTVTTKPFKGAHFATFPPDLIKPCVLAGCPRGGTVLDPFFGAGTTGLVALSLGREYVGIELSPEYVEIAKRRLDGVQMDLADELSRERPCGINLLHGERGQTKR